VLVTDGVLVTDKTVLGDGVLVTDGTTLGADAAMQALSAAKKGDDTASALPVPDTDY
jgi:hypothetical protein